MNFECTPVEGVFLITPDRHHDPRGYLSVTWSTDEFGARGLSTRVVQRNVSFNTALGTLRGMHFQHPPHAEVKLVSCLSGAIFDVAIDLRPSSPTYLGWYGAELTANSGAMLYVPEGCAHGYLTLAPDSTVEYLVSELYHPRAAGGVRWDDARFGVQWPASPRVINDRDRTYPDYEPET
jgi:dTDP-4-dehydrorhamnose 3,5-epimerase